MAYVTNLDCSGSLWSLNDDDNDDDDDDQEDDEVINSNYGNDDIDVIDGNECTTDDD